MPTLIHITDLHLNSRPIHGLDPAVRFERVLAAAMAAVPEADALVLGGDLVDDGGDAGYRWLDARLAGVHVPVLAVAGNHESPDGMHRLLRHARVHDTLALGGWQIIGLNTHVAGHDHGHLDARALTALDDTLAQHHGPALLVMHHPPVAVGSAWIDALGLAEADALADCLSRHSRVRGVLAGHVHQAHAGCFAGRPVWTTPATHRQFRPGATQFAEDATTPPGYRTVSLGTDGRIETRVRRVVC